MTADSGFAQQTADPTALSLEELLDTKVFSASKYEQNAAESPSSISVISAEEIRHYGYRTLLEVMESVPGFYVRNHDSYSTLGVRGFAPPGDSNGRILVLVNGHTINNNVDHSSTFENDFPIDMDLVDRIEVVRGPSSSLYGADAFFAVVNVIIRTRQSTNTVVSGEAGSLGTYKETATYNLDRRGTQAMFSASYWDTDAPGHLDKVQDPIGLSSDRDQTRRAFAMISSHNFTLQAALASVEQKAPPSAQWCGACHQTDSHSTNFRGYADLQYSHPIWKGTQFTARAFYDTYASHGTYNDLRECSEASCHGQLIDYDISHGDWAGGEVNLSRRFLGKHKVTIGAEYRDNFRQAQDNYILDNVPVTSRSYVDYNRTSALWGIYGEGEIRLHPKLLLDAGARTDRYNYAVGSSSNPRAALIYTPQKSTNLRFTYGTAFRAPSFYEMYYAGMASTAAPNLQPETIRTFEGVWTQQLGSQLSFSAAAFNNHIGSYIEEQTIEVKGIDQTSFFNSKAVAKGGELEFTDELSSGVRTRLSYTYQDARNVLPGAPLPDSPKHLTKLNVDVPLFRRTITPAVEAEYMSRSLTLWPATSYSAPPVALNATLSSRQFKGFWISGSAYNLVGRSMSAPTIGYFEQTHDVPSSSLLPSDRRTFRLKVTWTSGESGGHGKDKSNQQSEEVKH